MSEEGKYFMMFKNTIIDKPNFCNNINLNSEAARTIDLTAVDCGNLDL